MSSLYVGRNVKKVGAVPLLSGAGGFVGNIVLDRMANLSILRSPYSHARILNIDTTSASKLPGILKIVTGEEMKDMLNPYPQYPKIPGLRHSPCYPLAINRVRYQGEPVAVVVAESSYQGADALEEIKVEYEPLKPVVRVEDSSAQASSKLYDEWEDNKTLDFTVKGGDIEKAFSEAEQVVEGEVRIQRQCAAPLECRGYLASYDDSSQHLTLYASTQRHHVLKIFLSEVLGLSESKIRVIGTAIGGGFGLKTTPHKEEVIVCIMSKVTGKPVRWLESRSENLGAGGQAREQIHRFSAAVTNTGKILGVKDTIIADLGAYFPQPGVLQVLATAEMITGPYDIKNTRIRCLGYATNKPTFYPYRGFGEESATMFHERMIDLVASKLGIDRIAIRRLNVIKSESLPHKSVSGLTYDSGNYLELLNKAVEAVGAENFQQTKNSSGGDRLVGYGISLFVKPSAAAIPNTYVQGYESSTVRMDMSGKITVLAGSSPIGTGSETAISQIVADEIGVKMEDIEIVQGDTLACSFGLGAFASRTVVVAGSAALLAARIVKEKILKTAAFLLKCEPSDLIIQDGKVISKNSSETIDISTIAKSILKDPFRLPKEIGPGLEATYVYSPPNITNTPDKDGHMNTCATYSSAAISVAVEVSRETGEVKILNLSSMNDCGTIINPGLARGQVIGGLVQGIGSALYEESVYDESGQPLSSTFMHYILPSILEVPDIRVEFTETPSPYIPTGAKGVGEIGIQGLQAAILSAVIDAISPLGLDVSSYPLTPEKLWTLLHRS